MRSFCVPLIVLGVSAAAAAGFTVETIYVPMRDGVRLATDVYTDASLPKAPAVLMRTPYNKSRAKGAAE
jgi:predicted acyl esterase